MSSLIWFVTVWPDFLAQKVGRSNKYSCEDIDVIGLKMEKLLGVVINHHVRQPNGRWFDYHYLFVIFMHLKICFLSC